MSSILDRHRERFRAAPGDNRAFEALEEHLFLAGDWDEVIALYRHRLTAPALQASPKEQAQLYSRMAQVAREHLQDAERAIGWYRQALAADPAHLASLASLRRIHASRSQWDVALQIGEVEIGLPMRADERAGLLAEIGGIWLTHLDDTDQALVHLERALEESPGHKGAPEGAARAYAKSGNAERAADTWERLTEQLRGAARAEALVAAAKLAAGSLAQPRRAAELYRRALTDDPDNRDAIEAMAEETAARGQWALFADLQERRFDCAEDAEHRAEIALEAARVERTHLDNPGAARAWLLRASDAAPESVRILEALADLERDEGDDAALGTRLRRLVELRDEDAPASLLLEVASLCATNGDHEQALPYLERALARAPDDLLVIEAMAGSLTHLGREEELVELLERRAGLAEGDAARAAVLAELARLHEERLGDPEAARLAWERAHALDVSAPGAATALERLYRKGENWTALRAFLQDAAGRAPDHERSLILCSLGALLSTEFDETEQAADLLEEALALDPTSAAAYRGLQHLALRSGDEDSALRAYEREATVTSERMRLAFLVNEIVRICDARGDLGRAERWVERWVEVAPEEVAALEGLARVHEQLDHTPQLVDTLSRLDPLLDSDARASNRRRLGGVHAAAGDSDAAITAFQGALEADPGDVESLEALAEQLAIAQRIAEQVAALRRLADLVPPRRRAQCLDELAALSAERLGDLDGAIESLRALVRDPNAAPDVPERLETLLERAGRFEELADRLRTRAEEADDPTAIELTLQRAGVLGDHLDRADEAASAFREVLARDPLRAEAREGLERALRASGDASALAALLAEQLETAPDARTRERCAFERAVLLEDELDDSDAAREIYRELCADSEDPERRQAARDRLERLLERTGAWEMLRDHLEAALSDAPDPRDLRERLAHLYWNQFGDRARAIEHYEAAGKLAPGRPEAWRALAQLYHEEGHPEDLVRVMENELETELPTGRELTLRSRTAELCAETLGDPDRAVAHYERVLQLEPTHAAAAEYLIEHWERAGRLGDVVALLETRLADLDTEPREDPSWAARRTSLRVRIAGLRAGSLDDLDGAIAALEPGLGEIGPQSVVAEPLADLYQRAGYSDDLCDLCRSAASACSESDERANWYARLGDALRAARREREAAAAYRHALGERPTDRETQAALRELYRRLDEHEPLARLLEAEISHLAGRDEIPARMELAALDEGPLERPADALVQLNRVLQIEGTHPEALDRALTLAAQLGDLDGALNLLDAALDAPRAPGVRADLLSRRAALLGRLPSRLSEAAATYREVLALDPTRRPEREALREVLQAAGDFQGVLDCLYQQARGCEGEARAALLERAAATAEDHISPDAALPWLERLRRERPDDPSIAARVSGVHRRCGRPRALLRSLDRELALAGEDAATRLRLHAERARLLEEELGSAARAAAVWEEARRLAPQDAEILENLDRLYRALDRPRERAGVLGDLLREGASTSRVALLCEAATLCSGPLGDPARAAAHLLAAVAAAPRDTPMRAELLRSLGEALRASGQTEAWARCAEKELRSLDPTAEVFDDRRRTLGSELAEVYRRELGRPDAALRHLRAIADARPPGSVLDAIEPPLLELLRAEGNDVELSARLGAHMARRPDSPEGWLELARLHDEKLHAPAAAAEAYRNALQLAPRTLVAVRGLRSVAERLGRWDDVAEMLERELDLPGDASAPPARLLRRLGDVCWKKLQNTTRASRSYAAALEADPEDFEALRSLEQLLEGMEDWRGALDLYESEIEALGEREHPRRIEVALRAGEIARDRTDDPSRALRCYAYASALGTLPPQRTAELADLYFRCGDAASFADTFARWCDDPEAGADGADLTRLAVALESQGRSEEALARIDQALTLDPAHAPAWDGAARLREAKGDVIGAADALARTAELAADDSTAAARRLRAAELVEGDDLERAEALLRDAARSDPASAAVQAALARVSEQLCDYPEAVRAAERALELAADDDLDPGLRLATGLCGGRCARERGNYEAAARFYEDALAVEPEHTETLARQGETLAALGDLPGALRALTVRLAQDEPDANRGMHLAIVGAALEADGERDAARERFEAALEADPALERAHESLVRLHEEAERVDDGIAALERWADVAEDGTARGERLLRAAEWELSAGEREEGAEHHLREALDAAPTCGGAWEALADLLWNAERFDEALEVAGLALGSLEDPPRRARLALRQGRALERRGDAQGAARAFAMASDADPTQPEAALSRARLLRGLGQWREAADALAAYLENRTVSASEDGATLAGVLQQLGRLLAGPLEDAEGAIDAYRRAVECDPSCIEARSSLAGFLSHRPADFSEALTHHGVLLDHDPVHAPTLRAALRIARERGNTEGAERGLEILCALGCASPHERDEAASAPRHKGYVGERALADPLWERLRLTVRAASGELASALGASENPATIPAGDAASAFRAATLAAQGRLSSPALLPLPSDEIAEVVSLLATLALESEGVHGEGRLVNALTGALKRRARKKLRRILEGESIETIAGVDFAAWRAEIHGLGAAVALEENDFDLRGALLSLASDSEEVAEVPAAEADVSARIGASPNARALLRRVVASWLGSL